MPGEEFTKGTEGKWQNKTQTCTTILTARRLLRKVCSSSHSYLFSGYNFISLWGNKKTTNTFRFEKKCVRWMYEGFGGCNKKQQMAEEWLHAPVHFWAPGPVPTPMTPAEPLQWIAAQGSRIIPHVLERRGLAQAVVTHSSSCSHSIPPTGFKDNGYFLIFWSPIKLPQLQ